MKYFDNAATTYPKPNCVYEAMDNANRHLAVNAGRGSYKTAQEASQLIVETKELIRGLVNVDIATSVVFAPSITIAMNQIINGLNIRNNGVVYLSPYEHNAVARTIHKIAKQKSITVKLLPIDKDNLEIDIEKMKYDFAKDHPDAVFCTHVSNVTGYILPVDKIFFEAKKYEAITILDSAQSLGLIEIDAKKIMADIVAFAGHKTLYGPFGIGGFINIHDINLNCFITGGTGSDSLNLDMPQGKEDRYEAASTNIVAIAGLNAAIKDLDIYELRKKELVLTEYLIQKLNRIKEIQMFLPENRENHVGIVSFVVKGMSSEDIGNILDEEFDIALRTGYHCAPYIHEYLNSKKNTGTIRIGLGQFNTKEQIDFLYKAILSIVEG